jgi:hypothetical protein
VSVVDDALLPAALEAPNHVGSHSTQTDHAELHGYPRFLKHENMYGYRQTDQGQDSGDGQEILQVERGVGDASPQGTDVRTMTGSGHDAHEYANQDHDEPKPSR